MKILHILSDGTNALADAVISVHSKEDEVKIVDFSKGDIAYDLLVDDIFSYDRVLSW